MPTFHRVTTQRPTVHVCWRIDCRAPAIRSVNSRWYCAAHALGGPMSPPNASHPAVTAGMVQIARTRLADGVSLADAAQAVGVVKGDLDQALWRYIGERL